MASKCILKEEERSIGLLRDLLSDSFEEIVVDQETLFQDLKKYVTEISPDLQNIIKHYRKKDKSLFEVYEIDRQIRNSFGRSVTFVGGAYLVIDHTEAMHVIDVNSGNRIRKEEDQEMNVLNINLDACEEVARQLRLRDMGGLIMIDFIDMKRPTHRKMVFDKMEELLKLDRATSSVIPIGKFGVMELTRERVRPETNVEVTESCPSCNGTGTIQSSMKLMDELELHLKQIFFEQNEKIIQLRVNPFIHAYLTKGLVSQRMKWFFRYGKWIKLDADSTFSVNQYQFLNASGESMIMD
jgi:ribonuclease G